MPQLLMPKKLNLNGSMKTGAVAERTNPMPEVRGSGLEEQSHVQGVVAVWAQEGLEELFHIQGQWGIGEEICLIQGKEQRMHFAEQSWKDTLRPR